MPEAPSPQDIANSPSSDSSHSQTSGGEGVNFEELFGKTTEELKETKNKATKLETDFQRVDSENKKTQDKLERMRKALVGEIEGGEAGPDPYESEISALEAEIQEWVNDAWEAERAGKPITKTAKIAIDQAKFRIKALKKEKDQQAKISELENQLKKVSNPEFHGLNAMYDTTTHLITNALNAVYGQSDDYTEVKNVQLGAIQKLVGDEFENLQKNHPEDWERVKRDRTALGKLVQHFVKKSIPPVARKLMDDDEIRRTPMGFEQLFGAFKEQQAIYRKNPTQANKTQLVELRNKVWESYGQGQLKSNRKNLGAL
jgi:hypothetical protein